MARFMENVYTIRQLIGLWGSRAEFARSLEVPLARVHKWVSANSIPAKDHQRIIDDAICRNLPVTAELIVRLHAPAPTQPEDAA